MSFFSVDWSEFSLQVMVTFCHFLWQACVVAMLLGILEQLSSIVTNSTLGGRGQAHGALAPGRLRVKSLSEQYFCEVVSVPCSEESFVFDS